LHKAPCKEYSKWFLHRVAELRADVEEINKYVTSVEETCDNNGRWLDEAMRDLDEATRKLAEATVAELGWLPTARWSPTARSDMVTHCEEERDECEEWRDECEEMLDTAMKNLAQCRVVRDGRVTERDVAELGTGPPVPSREVWGNLNM
jgi:RNA processing factor Prp31